MSRLIAALIAASSLLLLLQAQPPAGGQGKGKGGKAGGRGAAASPRTSAAIDMTGYWVSVVTEDWMFRMVTPPKGQYLGVPLSAAARRAADAWDPAKDEAAGEQCRSYGAPALMRVPGRLHITWDNDTTMKIETEAGTQTRLFHFGAAQPAEEASSWQGQSTAEWETAASDGGARNGDLKVLTTHLKPGYLRKNGVPYSANTVLTEWYDRHTAPNGDVWLVVTTEVNDPANLTTPFITSTHFKKLPDSSVWKPEACSSR